MFRLGRLGAVVSVTNISRVEGYANTLPPGMDVLNNHRRGIFQLKSSLFDQLTFIYTCTAQYKLRDMDALCLKSHNVGLPSSQKQQIKDVNHVRPVAPTEAR